MTVLYKNLNLLKLRDVYKLELAKLVYQLLHNLVPKSLNESFVKIFDVHTHKTRQAQNVVHFSPPVIKPLGLELVDHRGCKLCEEIDKSTKDLNWFSFKKRYKEMLIKSYD